MKNIKPVVIVSKCLGFDKCRWNGVSLDDPAVKMLSGFVEFVPVCPEVEIGLGVPRRPIRMVCGKGKGEILLVQPATGGDVTTKMNSFCEKFLDNADGDHGIDGFFLKYKSPSCGPMNVNIYHKPDEGHVDRRGSGFFAALAQERFPLLAMEDEGRMHNFQIRENWLTRVFASARLRSVMAAGKISALVDFHAAHKYFLMSVNQTAMRAMGKLVANHEKNPFEDVFAEYRRIFMEALAQPPRVSNRINALQHMLGHFSKDLSADEKNYFLDVLEDFRREGLPMSVPINIIKSWAIRFKNDYLLKQVILEPYPAELVTVTDSGKGRKL